jgi:hypothetical protein
MLTQTSFVSPYTTRDDRHQTQHVLHIAAASFRIPHGLVGWKKRWQLHLQIVRQSANEVKRMQTVDTEPDQTDCHFCIKAHRTAFEELLREPRPRHTQYPPHPRAVPCAS